jgi:hypothetical protein
VEQLLSETGPPSGALPEEPLLLPLEDPPLLEPLPPPDDPPEPPLDELAAPDELPELLLAPEPASVSAAWPGAPEEQAAARRNARRSAVVLVLIGVCPSAHLG